MISTANLPSCWKEIIDKEMENPYLTKIQRYLDGEAALGKKIYPQPDKIFEALRLVPLKSVRVVIIGQDPYHGPGQAHGLSFSVNKGVKIPPSLKNIYKEIQGDYGHPSPTHGNLLEWATQGVLLLNASLTVEHAKAASHSKIGWQQLTDKFIRVINEQNEHVVFILWGGHAQKKKSLIDQSKHLVLESVHPSPLSFYKGFLGCGHFRSANEYLAANGRGEINWTLSE